MGGSTSSIPYDMSERSSVRIIPDPKQKKRDKEEPTEFLDRGTFEGSAYKKLVDEAGELGTDPQAPLRSLESFLQRLAEPRLSPTQVISNLGVGFQNLFLPADRKVELYETDRDGQSWCEREERARIEDALPVLRQQIGEMLERQLRSGRGPEYDAIRRQHASLPVGERERFEAALCSAALWSAPEGTRFRGAGREICWLINLALDLDDEELLRHALPLIRGLSKFCVLDRLSMKHLSPVQLPPVNMNGDRVTFRGGGMNEAHIPFFTCGKMFRFPGFVATSFSRSVAEDFMRRATHKEFPAVEWTFVIPDRCYHVMYLQPEFSLVGSEREYLLAPYTCCQVVKVEWQQTDDWRSTNYNNPHRITLKVAVDNKLAPENLPISPWR